MPHEKLSDTTVQGRLPEIPGWIFEKGKLVRKVNFQDFSEAFAFMTRAALVSERLNHHPEWSNVYNRVSISLWSHDCDGISERDFSWAKAINSLLTPPKRTDNL